MNPVRQHVVRINGSIIWKQKTITTQMKMKTFPLITFHYKNCHHSPPIKIYYKHRVRSTIKYSYNFFREPTEIGIFFPHMFAGNENSETRERNI